MPKPEFSHLVLAGDAVSSKHPSAEDATIAATKLAQQGKLAMVVALVSVIQTKTEIETTLADGTTSTAAVS
jgi:hypothetical protein